MPDPADLKERVSRVLAQEVAPALQLDGTGIEVLGVADGVVRLRLGEAVPCCPSTLMTIFHGLEHELRRHFPEVEYVEVVP